MSTEIEHKYLVVSEEYEKLAKQCYKIAQGYLCREPERTIRVRLQDKEAFLTVKGRNHGDTRLEFEYRIPYGDGVKLLELCCGRVIRKKRYIVPFGGFTWEVDVYEGDLAPLKVAEIELGTSTHDYPLPPFAGKEVTGDPAYYNSNL